jgi:hypothetical protein
MNMEQDSNKEPKSSTTTTTNNNTNTSSSLLNDITKSDKYSIEGWSFHHNPSHHISDHHSLDSISTSNSIYKSYDSDMRGKYSYLRLGGGNDGEDWNGMDKYVVNSALYDNTPPSSTTTRSIAIKDRKGRRHHHDHKHNMDDSMIDDCSTATNNAVVNVLNNRLPLFLQFANKNRSLASSEVSSYHTTTSTTAPRYQNATTGGGKDYYYSDSRDDTPDNCHKSGEYSFSDYSSSFQQTATSEQYFSPSTTTTTNTGSATSSCMNPDKSQSICPRSSSMSYSSTTCSSSTGGEYEIENSLGLFSDKLKSLFVETIDGDSRSDTSSELCNSDVCVDAIVDLPWIFDDLDDECHDECHKMKMDVVKMNLKSKKNSTKSESCTTATATTLLETMVSPSTIKKMNHNSSLNHSFATTSGDSKSLNCDGEKDKDGSQYYCSNDGKSCIKSSQDDRQNKMISTQSGDDPRTSQTNSSDSSEDATPKITNTRSTSVDTNSRYYCCGKSRVSSQPQQSKIVNYTSSTIEQNEMNSTQSGDDPRTSQTNLSDSPKITNASSAGVDTDCCHGKSGIFSQPKDVEKVEDKTQDSMLEMNNVNKKLGSPGNVCDDTIKVEINKGEKVRDSMKHMVQNKSNTKVATSSNAGRKSGGDGSVGAKDRIDCEYSTKGNEATSIALTPLVESRCYEELYESDNTIIENLVFGNVSMREGNVVQESPVKLDNRIQARKNKKSTVKCDSNQDFVMLENRSESESESIFPHSKARANPRLVNEESSLDCTVTELSETSNNIITSVAPSDTTILFDLIKIQPSLNTIEIEYCSGLLPTSSSEAITINVEGMSVIQPTDVKEPSALMPQQNTTLNRPRRNKDNIFNDLIKTFLSLCKADRGEQKEVDEKEVVPLSHVTIDLNIDSDEDSTISDSSTQLISRICEKAWDRALLRLDDFPLETRVWTTLDIANLLMDETKERQSIKSALSTESSSSLKNVYVLPLHAACYVGAPITLIKSLINIYPEATRQKVPSNSKLPLHIACEADADPEVISYLINSWPMSIYVCDGNGNIPLSQVILSKPLSARKKETMDVLLLESKKMQLLKKQDNFQSTHSTSNAM